LLLWAKMRQSISDGLTVKNYIPPLCDEKGNHLKRATVLYRFKKTLKKAGLPDIRFHDLRHTNQGENIRTVQSQMGHSTQTSDTYSHLMKNPDSDIAGRLEKAFLKACSQILVRKAVRNGFYIKSKILFSKVICLVYETD